MKRISAMLVAAVFGLGVAGAALAKLPPPTEEQKKAAEEKKVKDAESAKKAAELLDKAQDRAAEHYMKEMKAKGMVVKPTPMTAAAPAPAAKEMKK